MPDKKSSSTSIADNAGNTDLGRASYRAEQAREAVIIFAFGWNPTPGYTNFFEQSPIDVFPPEFIFRSIPPGGFVPQVLTPFAIWVMFGATEPIKTVTVHDADGPHEIPVEEMSDAQAAAIQRATWVSGHVVRGGGAGGRASTMGIGEEEPGPTQVRGEEDFARMGGAVGARASTGPFVNEEDPGPGLGEGLPPRWRMAPTTMATGEEGGGPTTMATGEETITAPTTMATGEEGGGPTTMATGEEEVRSAATFGGGPITTLAIGEEAAPTTLRLGEEGFTTLAVGEEGATTLQFTTLDLGEEAATTLRFAPTTLAVGEEDPTTQAVGEEGPTTLAVGEENPTTDAVGEEGPTTMAVGEETTQFVRSTPFGSF